MNHNNTLFQTSQSTAQTVQTMPILTANGVSQSFRDSTDTITVLTEACLSVAAGQSVALVGASGSGKSTLLALLAGLDSPTAGTVTLFGHDLTHVSEEGRAALRRGSDAPFTHLDASNNHHLKRGVGFVFQNFLLMPHLTALENVLLPIELASPKKPYAEQQAMALKWLTAVGLTAQAQQRARVLSGGEQQRVALARAFATNPAIIFADEPTGSLDHATGQRIEALLFEQVQLHQTALVLVTHDLALAQRCDKIYQIEQGRVQLIKDINKDINKDIKNIDAIDAINAINAINVVEHKIFNDVV
jgi:putative ABC transport system ATP-binding protein